MLTKKNTYQQQNENVDCEFKRLTAEAVMSEKAAVELRKWYTARQTNDEL
jgi:hypothetical protein